MISKTYGDRGGLKEEQRGCFPGCRNFRGTKFQINNIMIIIIFDIIP